MANSHLSHYHYHLYLLLTRNLTRRTTKKNCSQGPMEKISQARFSGPLTLGLSIFVVLPYTLTLIAMTTVCFAISYIVFMRQEIRSLSRYLLIFFLLSLTRTGGWLFLLHLYWNLEGLPLQRSGNIDNPDTDFVQQIFFNSSHWYRDVQKTFCLVPRFKISPVS